MQTRVFDGFVPDQVMSSMWPSPTFHFEICETSKDQQVLHFAERSLIEGANLKRQQDFCSGRYCAHRILDKLGYREVPVLSDPYGAPCWPADIVGSISHSGGMAMAVAAYQQHVRTLGFDIQAYERPFPYDTLDMLFRPEEKQSILSIAPELMDLYAYSIFSAKESVFKCCYSAFGCLLEWCDIAITLDWVKGIFVARTPQHPICESFFDNSGLTGSIFIDNSCIYTGIWLSAAPYTRSNG
ncbi:4'-phosphopantetheinyl transferase superfamily protein [Nitrosomonas sp.]|uniref:4'-phosphopantetheinyl transferase family protein n=1 Tax=Nitrosomonas sp. TaxID=42353 RepID=UPI00262953C5|nr:4'-phosphopantetheinyl transferase superfamily protein [Nitrosomonas sp.]